MEVGKMIAANKSICFASTMLIKHTEYGSPEWFWCFNDEQKYHWNNAKKQGFEILPGQEYCFYRGFKALPEITKIAEKLDCLWIHSEVVEFVSNN